MSEQAKFWKPALGDYIFERGTKVGHQMICEVRGVGAGLYDRNSKLLLDALNNSDALRARCERLEKALKHISDNSPCTCSTEVHQTNGDFPNCPCFVADAALSHPDVSQEKGEEPR